MKNTYKFLLFIGLLLFSDNSSSCPCGCGAVGPLIISPGEKYKIQVGLSRLNNRNRLDINGNIGFDDGPQFTDQFKLGIAAGINDRLSVSAQGAIERNFHRETGSDLSPTDPNFGIRYTMYQPGLNFRFLPTVQIFGVYKHSFSKGLLEAADKDHQLDIHGNSISEYGPGIDLWFTHANVTFGLGSSTVFSRAVLLENLSRQQLLEKELMLKSNISVSYTFFGKGQFIVSLGREVKDQDKIDSELIHGSESKSHSISLTTNIRTGFRKTLSFNYLNSGSVLSNKNVPKRETLSVDYIHII